MCIAHTVDQTRMRYTWWQRELELFILEMGLQLKVSTRLRTTFAVNFRGLIRRQFLLPIVTIDVGRWLTTMIFVQRVRHPSCFLPECKLRHVTQTTAAVIMVNDPNLEKSIIRKHERELASLTTPLILLAHTIQQCSSNIFHILQHSL